MTYLSLNFGALTIRITNTGVRFSWKLFKKKSGKFFSVPSSTVGKTITYRQMKKIVNKFGHKDIKHDVENIEDVRNNSIKGITLSNYYIDKIKNYRVKTNIFYIFIALIALGLIYMDIFTPLINFDNVIFSIVTIVLAFVISFVFTKLSIENINFKENIVLYEDIESFVERVSNREHLLVNTGIYTVKEKREYCNLEKDYIFEKIEVEKDFPEGIRSDSKSIAIKPWNQEFYFTRECLIVEEENDYVYYDYGNIKIEKREIEFTYKDNLDDYLSCEERWLYINKDGSKDKRYSDNYQIKIYKKEMYYIEMDQNHSIGILV